MGMGDLVNHAFGGKGAEHMAIAAHSPSWKADFNRRMIDRDIGYRIGRHRACNRQPIGLALAIADCGPSGLVAKQTLAKFALERRRAEPRVEPCHHAAIGTAHPNRDQNCGRRARARVKDFLPARPDKLHRPAHFARNQRRFNRVAMLQTAIETAACGHGIEHCRIRPDPQRFGSSTARGLRRLGSHPQLKLAILEPRRGARRFNRRVERRLELVTHGHVAIGRIVITLTARFQPVRRAFANALVDLVFNRLAIDQQIDIEARLHRGQRLLRRPPIGCRCGQPALAIDRADIAAHLLGRLRIKPLDLGLVMRAMLDRGIDHIGQTDIACEQIGTINLGRIIEPRIFALAPAFCAPFGRQGFF